MAAAGKYFAPAALAYGAYNFEKASFKSEGDYNTLMAQMSASGYAPSTIAMADKYASTPTVGMSSLTKMKAFNYALMGTQDPNMALQLAPTVASGTLAANRLIGEITPGQQKHAFRAAETIGGSDAAKWVGQ